MRIAIIASLATVSLGASELLDPPNTFGPETHRMYHFVAGGLIEAATLGLEHKAAPAWCRRHPVLEQIIAGAVVCSAGIGKEVLDHRYGSESRSHSLGDIATTTAGGLCVGLAFHVRF